MAASRASSQPAGIPRRPDREGCYLGFTTGAFRFEGVIGGNVHGSCFLFSMIFMGISLGLRRSPEVGARHFFRAPFVAAILAGLVLLSMVQNAGAYVLENKSWPPESAITLQLGLGTPSHSLQDGSPTWDAAIARF